jgi:exopolysaccharide biosynthesis protein
VVSGSGSNQVTYFVADVTLSNATKLRSAFANNEFGTNIIDVPSSIAKQNGAMFAVNGDYYGFRDSGLEIRNGIVYRDQGARDGLAMYRDGTVKVYDETKADAKALVADGVWNTMSFGPALLVNGQIPSGIESFQVDTNLGARTIQGLQPRTGIGIISANHYVFVVVDGRHSGYSRGVTMTEMASIFQDLNCTVAYNMDGGGSAEMWFNGSVVNRPSGDAERGTSDIFYFAG